MALLALTALTARGMSISLGPRARASSQKKSSIYLLIPAWGQGEGAMPAANSADSANRSAQVNQPYILNRGCAGFGSVPVLPRVAPRLSNTPPQVQEAVCRLTPTSER